jgi:hypothetical protein
VSNAAMNDAIRSGAANNIVNDVAIELNYLLPPDVDLSEALRLLYKEAAAQSNLEAERRLAKAHRYLTAKQSDVVNNEQIAVSLEADLAVVKREVQALSLEARNSKELQEYIQKLEASVTRAAATSSELTARMLLPPREVTDVPLVPVHYLQRLEQTSNDLNLASAGLTLALGAILT